ncbi:hypothetical protein [Rosistilla oblonga]|uniref:hypothetical protein n=1 Tax=Rosistilla oblonga TaxID=2527990 RepID=UPI003A96B9BC
MDEAHRQAAEIVSSIPKEELAAMEAEMQPSIDYSRGVLAAVNMLSVVTTVGVYCVPKANERKQFFVGCAKYLGIDATGRK